MSKQFDNNMRGVLFKNDEKKTEKHPDYSGNATIEGVEYFMDAWIKSAESGRKFMSFSFKAKQKQQSQQQRPAKSVAEMDDDIPW